MKSFLINIARFSLIGFIPMVILLAGYFYYDPFKVVHQYNDYSHPNVIPNRDYISTEMFLRNKDKYHYNSFIFGSSRTLAFTPASWKKHLPGNAVTFMFDGSNETIYGICKKLLYLDSIHAPINNALIILCRDESFGFPANPREHLFIKHPATSGESPLAFQNTFLRSYLDPRFLFSFYSYTFTKTYKPFMKGYIENKAILFDTVSNQMSISDEEYEIETNPNAFYAKHKDLFYERIAQRTDNIQRITRQQLKLLKQIASLLEKNHTKYKVVISPLYEQVKLSQADMKILSDLFGDHLYDFSGRNYFTEEITNYYETSHYRPVVGDSIMNMIYH